MKTTIQSHKRLFLTAGILIAGWAVALVLVAGCGGRGNLANIATGLDIGKKVYKSATLSEEDEQQMGKSVAIAGTNQFGYCDKQALNDYVTLVGLTVSMGSPRPDRNYTFGVLDSSDVGAFSGPGGYIMITRGAIEQMQDESELAGVLAHEVGHVAKQHGLDEVRKSGVLDAGLEAVNTNREMAQFGQITDALVDGAFKKPHSRTQETEADSEAVTYLINTGYDPRGYLTYMKRLEAKKKTAGSGGLMSTHPGMDERIVAVSAQIDKAGVQGGQRLPERFVQRTAALRRVP